MASVPVLCCTPPVLGSSPLQESACQGAGAAKGVRRPGNLGWLSLACAATGSLDFSAHAAGRLIILAGCHPSFRTLDLLTIPALCRGIFNCVCPPSCRSTAWSQPGRGGGRLSQQLRTSQPQTAAGGTRLWQLEYVLVCAADASCSHACAHTVQGHLQPLLSMPGRFAACAPCRPRRPCHRG